MKVNSLRIPCHDLIASEVFYTNQLGLNKVFGSAEEGVIAYQLENVQLLLELEEKGEFECGRYLGFSVEVEDIQTFYDHLLSNNVVLTGPPEDQFWGGKMTHIIDCNKNTFSVVELVG